MYNFGARSTLYLTFFSFCEMTITQRKPNETFRHFPWKSACMNFVPSRHSQILESIMPFNSQLPRLLVKCSNPRENHDRSIQEKYGRQKVPKYVFYWFSAWYWMMNGDLIANNVNYKEPFKNLCFLPFTFHFRISYQF